MAEERKTPLLKQNDYVNEMREQIYQLIADYTGQDIKTWSVRLYEMLELQKDIIIIRPLTSALLILQQIVKDDKSINAKKFWDTVINFEDIMKHSPISEKEAFAKLLDFIRITVHQRLQKSIDFEEKVHAKKLKDPLIDAHIDEMRRILRLRDGISDEQYEIKFQHVDYAECNIKFANFVTKNEKAIKAKKIFTAKSLFSFRDKISKDQKTNAKNHYENALKTFTSALKIHLSEEDFKYVTSSIINKPSDLKLVFKKLKEHSPKYKPQHFAYVVYLLSRGRPELLQYGLDHIEIKPAKPQTLFSEQQDAVASDPTHGIKHIYKSEKKL